MATLIPSIGSCAARMTAGERRLAERLEQKLDDDYLLWYDVPVGPKQAHPDFVIMHPRRGILILEVKDWKPGTILRADRDSWEILDSHGQPKTVPSPMEQARQYAHQVVNALERDPPLVQAAGAHQGKLAFPWSYGVVLTNLTRKQFTEGELGQIMTPHRVICSDEMLPSIEAEDLQSRLWDMFPHQFHLGVMTLPQLTRVRWIMFPEIRVPLQGALFDDSDEDAKLPDIMRVMDLQQEQLARSLGDGHRVIHGVAGSGKTMILGYRAEYLAKASAPGAKPILILCFNEPLAVKLGSMMEAKGLTSRVHVWHFHKWCFEELRTFRQSLPADNPNRDVFFAEMVERVIRAVERKHIPAGQYQAVLIDEGHDFAPEWLKLITQMVDPATNSLLVLCDDAQNIYDRGRSRQFSFKSVGIQAQGRTTILKINYRNTRQILQLASLIAADLLTPDDKDEDGIPLVKPISCGRDGEEPLIVRLPSFREETFRIADLLSAAHEEGYAWGDMAIICRHNWMREKCASALQQRGLPHETRIGPGTFNPNIDSIKLLRMDVCKGLEFPVVVLPGMGHLPTMGEDEREEARLFYVAATRATQRLVVTASGGGNFGQKLEFIE